MNADLQSARPVLEGERIEGDAVTVEDRGRIVDRTVNEECHVAPVLIHKTDKHAENQAFEDYVQSTLDTVAEEPKTSDKQKENDEVKNQAEVAAVLVEVGQNEGLEWKVCENKPIHICGKAANSTDEECVFALCGNCFLPPETRRSAGRKRKRGATTGDSKGCNHKDMNSLRSFDAPSFFTAKYRENQVKHFPTKCANCKVGFRDRLSRVEEEVEERA
jgi:hypothetical protein